MVVLEALTHHISEFHEDYVFGRNTEIKETNTHDSEVLKLLVIQL